jgi:hypothetical protein
LTSEQFKKEYEKQRQWVAAHPPLDTKYMQGLHDAFGDLKDEIDAIGQKFLNAFAGDGATAVGKLATVIHNEVEDIEAIGRGLAKIGGFFDKIGGHGDILGESVTKMLHPGDATKQFLDALPKSKNYNPRSGYHPSAFIEGGGIGGSAYR